jgi:membrane protease YdiL (CAAX protease family)
VRSIPQNQPATSVSPFYGQGQFAAPLDPDRPWWGVGIGILVWISSIAALFMVQVVAIIVWVVIEQAQTGQTPPPSIENPRLALLAVLSSIPAHLITLAVCWSVVTKNGRRPFLESLGWHWAGLRMLYRVGLVAGVVVFSVGVAAGLSQVFPEKETEFEKLLSVSLAVRITLAILAVFTAPLVEELVYRGVLYSGLRRRLGVWPTVVVVTSLFAGVHFVQYWGAWASLIQLTFLSFCLTIIRARSRSVLPSFTIHTVFNIMGAVVFLSRAYPLQ